MTYEFPEVLQKYRKETYLNVEFVSHTEFILDHIFEGFVNYQVIFQNETGQVNWNKNKVTSSQIQT